MPMRLTRFARFVAFVLVIGALAAPTAAAHHLELKQPGGGDSSQPSGGPDGGVVAIAVVGLLGLGLGAAVAVERRENRQKGATP